MANDPFGEAPPMPKYPPLTPNTPAAPRAMAYDALPMQFNPNASTGAKRRAPRHDDSIYLQEQYVQYGAPAGPTFQYQKDGSSILPTASIPASSSWFGQVYSTFSNMRLPLPSPSLKLSTADPLKFFEAASGRIGSSIKGSPQGLGDANQLPMMNFAPPKLPETQHNFLKMPSPPQQPHLNNAAKVNEDVYGVRRSCVPAPSFVPLGGPMRGTLSPPPKSGFEANEPSVQSPDMLAALDRLLDDNERYERRRQQQQPHDEFPKPAPADVPLQQDAGNVRRGSLEEPASLSRGPSARSFAGRMNYRVLTDAARSWASSFRADSNSSLDDTLAALSSSAGHDNVLPSKVSMYSVQKTKTDSELSVFIDILPEVEAAKPEYFVIDIGMEPIGDDLSKTAISDLRIPAATPIMSMQAEQRWSPPVAGGFSNCNRSQFIPPIARTGPLVVVPKVKDLYQNNPSLKATTASGPLPVCAHLWNPSTRSESEPKAVQGPMRARQETPSRDRLFHPIFNNYLSQPEAQQDMGAPARTTQIGASTPPSNVPRVFGTYILGHGRGIDGRGNIVKVQDDVPVAVPAAPAAPDRSMMGTAAGDALVAMSAMEPSTVETVQAQIKAHVSEADRLCKQANLLEKELESLRQIKRQREINVAREKENSFLEKPPLYPERPKRVQEEAPCTKETSAGKSKSETPAATASPAAVPFESGSTLTTPSIPTRPSALSSSSSSRASTALQQRSDVLAMEKLLQNSARKGDLEGVRTAIQSGLIVSADLISTRTGWTLLLLAAKNGHTDIVEYLIQKANCDVHQSNNDGEDGLFWASAGGHINTMKCLLRAGANPNARCKDGRTAMSIAAFCGQTDACSCLIQAGGNADVEDKRTKRPLHYAANEGHASTVSILLTAGKASPHAIDQHKWTPLMFAASKGRVDCVKAILSSASGAEYIEQKSANGRTALDLANDSGFKGIVDILLLARQ
ncbi:hypothetical protein HK102_000564 [Quaeritorhiza haematococci]|nr:hypothetical protein HK102_000564 [Quaeritorhiza haematococci]